MPWTEIVLVNQDTGKRESYGMLAKKLIVGQYTLVLTYDESRQMWWILAMAETGKLTMGYHEDRREDCWKAFFYLADDERRIAQEWPS